MQRRRNKSNLIFPSSKKLISNFAEKVNNGIQNNKALLNLINHNQGQLSRNKRLLLKYSESQETKPQLAKSLNAELKNENKILQENNLKLIKDIQNLKEKVILSYLKYRN
jgi:hypothetical protein